MTIESKTLLGKIKAMRELEQDELDQVSGGQWVWGITSGARLDRLEIPDVPTTPYGGD